MNKTIKTLIFMAISIGIISIISIGIIALFSNIFVSGVVFNVCGGLTAFIVIVGLRLMGKDIYKFIDNYKIKNLNYLWILFLFYLLLSSFLSIFFRVYLKNYFLFISSENALNFMNGLLLQQFLIIFLRLKGIDKYKEMMKSFKA